MIKKIATAVGEDSIFEYLIKKQYEVVGDIAYQEGVLELMKKEFLDVLIVYSELDGDLDKYVFLDKIREADSKLKIIIIMPESDDNYKRFLWSKGVFDILIDGVSSFEELEKCINGIEYSSSNKPFSGGKLLNMKRNTKNNKMYLNSELMLKFQKQQIITFAGIGSSGKTTIATEVAKILAEKTKAKVLIIDFDTVNAGLNQFMGIKKEPENPGYILPSDKNSSLNYMIDAIDKRCFNINVFEKYLLKSKKLSNLDILTGNKSLYICKNILSSEYYLRVLEMAKSLYDYIIIDTSNNIFLDSMQFSVLNATKVFVVAEGNYISLERNYRLLSELFSIWGVHNKKVKVIINKYSGNSLDKNIIKEMLKEFEIAGYISFSGKYEELINMKNSKTSSEIIGEYYSILEDLEIIGCQEWLNKKSGKKQKFFNLKNNVFWLKNA